MMLTESELWQQQWYWQNYCGGIIAGRGLELRETKNKCNMDLDDRCVMGLFWVPNIMLWIIPNI